MSRTRMLLAVACLLLASPAASTDTSIQCDGGIVSAGDGKVDLLGKCGQPALVEERRGVRHSGSEQTVEVATLVTTEVWTYNFGSSRFVQFVTLVDGKVTSVERGGYGYRTEDLRQSSPPGRARCDPEALHLGDHQLDLLARCGAPVLKESRLEKRTTGAATAMIEIETWTFDFGPQRFTQRVTLEDGKVTRVEHGGYGYTP